MHCKKHIANVNICLFSLLCDYGSGTTSKIPNCYSFQPSLAFYDLNYNICKALKPSPKFQVVVICQVQLEFSFHGVPFQLQSYLAYPLIDVLFFSNQYPTNLATSAVPHAHFNNNALGT